MGLTNVDLDRIDGNSGTLANVNTSSINGGPLAGFRNVLLNPYHEIHQRGTGVITVGGGGAVANPTGSDGWRCFPRTSSYTVQTRVFTNAIPVSFNTPSRNALYMNDTGANNSYHIWQLIELPETGLGPFQPGTKWTLRFVLQASQSFDLGATLILGTNGATTTADAQGVSTDPATSVGNYKEFVFTFDIPDDGSWVRAAGDYTVALRINIGANGVQREVWLGSAQLEPGSVATPFERRSYSIEQLLCSRYYHTNVEPGTLPTKGGGSYFEAVIASVVNNGTSEGTAYRFPVPMRVVPTLTVYSPNNGTAGQAWSEITQTNVSYSAVATSKNIANGSNPTGSGISGNRYYFHYAATAEL